MNLLLLQTNPPASGISPTPPQFSSDSLPNPRPALRYWIVMPINDLQQAAQKIAGFLATLNKLGGLRLKYRISAPEAVPDAEEKAPALCVELGGPDVLLVTQHDGELLLALETIAAQILRLDQREGDLVSFDAENFKALRAQEQQLKAEIAADKVIRSGIPYAFPAMNSRERRLLHMAFKGI
jgi:spoIIIJ-associated protein